MSMRQDFDILLLLYILSNNQLLCLSLLDSKSKTETPNDKACSKFLILDKWNQWKRESFDPKTCNALHLDLIDITEPKLFGRVGIQTRNSCSMFICIQCFMYFSGCISTVCVSFHNSEARNGVSSQHCWAPGEIHWKWWRVSRNDTRR